MYNVLPSVIYVYIFTLHGDGTVHVAVLVCDGEQGKQKQGSRILCWWYRANLLSPPFITNNVFVINSQQNTEGLGWALK
jgi:hypothetical protein